MKFAADRPYSDPEKAARKIVEIANGVEVVQDGRVYIELINGPFLFREKGTPDEYKAGLGSGDRARMAGDARERHLWPVHARRRRAVRISARKYSAFAIAQRGPSCAVRREIRSRWR